jgi:hypothetical protein
MAIAMIVRELELQGHQHRIAGSVGEVVRTWDIRGVVGILDVRNWGVFTNLLGLRHDRNR